MGQNERNKTHSLYCFLFNKLKAIPRKHHERQAPIQSTVDYSITVGGK